MQGRLENEMKIFKTADALMESMPSFANEWYMNMKASRKTASSCYDYVRKIRRFLEYINNDIKHMNVNEITLQTCESYMIACQTKKGSDGIEVFTSDSYQQGIWSAINNFLKFLSKRKYIEYNFMDDIEKPKNKDLDKINRARVLLTKKDFKKILASAKEGSNYSGGLFDNRNILIVMLFMTTGIRNSALSEIDIDDIDASNNTLIVTDKGNIMHTYYLDNDVIYYFKKWIKDRDKIAKSESNKALFVNKNGERITSRGISKMITKCCKEGIGKNLSPHKLRSGFCSILYDETKDIEFVRRAVGHANIHTTQRYIKTNDNEKETASKIMNNIFK